MQNVINVEQSSSPTQAGPTGGGSWQVIHGSAVKGFVNKYCHDMNFATGGQPDIESDETKTVFGCFTKETEITLASGKQLPIEQVTAGTKILAHGGDISTVTDEEVQNHAPDGHYIFGRQAILHTQPSVLDNERMEISTPCGSKRRKSTH